jgi:hypothetical protein
MGCRAPIDLLEAVMAAVAGARVGRDVTTPSYPCRVPGAVT